jgi:predicted DNA-binding transcriptional regulator AlpA
MSKHSPTVVSDHSGPPSPAAVAALEKIPSAARRMGLSLSGFYRVAKRDGLTIVKVGERASAAIADEVDSWIARRITAAKGCAK